MDFKFDGLNMEYQPSITKWSFEDIEDAPHLHRWRASWFESGIAMDAFPVIRATPTGVWIARHAYREWSGGERVWAGIDKKRWIANDSGSSYAKKTQEDAIKSIAIRLTRWSVRILSERERAEMACDALEKLRPDLALYAQTARTTLLTA